VERRRVVRRSEDLPASAALGDALSPRELEVARLVANGYSNREIATVLVVGEDTVKKHVSHALAKLGLHNRTELALAVAQLSVLVDRLT
jgi:DNA-binding NarL/FixJ family response regulator